MPLANGIDITPLIEAIGGGSSGRIPSNAQVKRLTKLVQDLSKFEAKVESNEKALLNIKIGAQSLKLSFDPAKQQPIEELGFVVNGRSVSATDLLESVQGRLDKAMASLDASQRAEGLVGQLTAVVDRVVGTVTGIKLPAAVSGLLENLDPPALLGSVTDTVGGLLGDPAQAVSGLLGSLGGTPSLPALPLPGAPSPDLVGTAGMVTGPVGAAGGTQAAPALDFFDSVAGDPAAFGPRVVSNTSTAHTGSDQTAAAQQLLQGGAPTDPLGTVVGLVGTLSGSLGGGLLGGLLG